jgi:hypothetical protein
VHKPLCEDARFGARCWCVKQRGEIPTGLVSRGTARLSPSAGSATTDEDQIPFYCGA